MKRSSISLAIAFVALGSNALAQDAVGRFSPAELTKRTLERRAMDAAIWGMPIGSFDVMRQGFCRDAKAHYGDGMYWARIWAMEANTCSFPLVTKVKHRWVILRCPRIPTMGSSRFA